MTKENLEAYTLGTLGAFYGLYEVLVRETLTHYIGKLTMRLGGQHHE